MKRRSACPNANTPLSPGVVEELVENSFRDLSRGWARHDEPPGYGPVHRPTIRSGIATQPPSPRVMLWTGSGKSGNNPLPNSPTTSSLSATQGRGRIGTEIPRRLIC
jgi:hypothetical protein